MAVVSAFFKSVLQKSLLNKLCSITITRCHLQLLKFQIPFFKKPAA